MMPLIIMTLSITSFGFTILKCLILNKLHFPNQHSTVAVMLNVAMLTGVYAECHFFIVMLIVAMLSVVAPQIEAVLTLTYNMLSTDVESFFCISEKEKM